MVKIIDCNIFETDAEVICHQVNCTGVLDYAVGKQIKERYPRVFENYQNICQKANHDQSVLLGTIADIPVSDKKDARIICSLFGQGSYPGSGFCYTNYDALRECLEKVKKKYKTKRIALPYRMSCSVAGGDWRIVEEIILDVLGGLDVTICRFRKND